MAFIVYFILLGVLNQPLEVDSFLPLSKGQFSDCGNVNKRLAILSGSVQPNPIRYPGNVTLTIKLEVVKDLPPANFEMKVNLEKLTPLRMAVPCFYTVGSCAYDVCAMIMKYKETLCPLFPNPNECGCPMKAATYKINVGIPLPNYGEMLINLLKGSYEGTLIFLDKSSDTEVGCIAFAFEIVSGK